MRHQSGGVEFEYVDSAAGGFGRRNNPVRLADLNPSSRAKDCGTTWLRFTEDYVHHAEAMRERNSGKRSVAGYEGLAWTPFVPLDVDRDGDPAAALEDARKTVRRLENLYDVPLDALRIFFSGSKGYAIELPGVLFGGFEPHVDLNHVVGYIAERLTGDLAGFDPSIYLKTGLWRLPNTINAKSGLYKVPLTIGELLKLELRDILTLATAPRTIEVTPADEFMAVETLVELNGVALSEVEGSPGFRMSTSRAARSADNERGTDTYTGDSTALEDLVKQWGLELLGRNPVHDTAATLKQRIVCPWADEHSGGDATGTYIMEFADGAKCFTCYHGHCLGRRFGDVYRKFNEKRYVDVGGRFRRVYGRREVVA